MKIKRKILNKVSKQIMSEFIFTECAAIAYRAKELLSDHGVESRVESGYAAFRVGEHDCATVCYSPAATNKPDGQEGGVFHAWLDVDGRIFDFSTFTLPQAVEFMAQQEGRDIPTEWNHDYVYTSKSGCHSFEAVRDGYDLAFWYDSQSHIAGNGIGAE